MKKVIENSMYAIKYIKTYHSSYFYANILLSFSESFVAVLTVLSTRFILNTFTSKQSFNDIYLVIILLALVNISDGSIRSFVKYKITPKATQNIRARMQKDLFAKAANINPVWYDTNSFYDKYCLALQNSENRILAVLNELNAFISAVLKSFSLLLIVLALQPWLILLVVVLVIWNIFFSIKTSKYSYEYSLSIVSSQRKMSYINRVFYVKRYSQELRTTKIKEVLLNRFEENIKEINKQIDFFSKFLLRIQLLQINFQALINSFILIVLAKQIFSGLLGIGDFFALTTSVSQLVTGFQDIFKTIPHLYENSLYIQNYRDFFSLKSENKFKNRVACEDIKIIKLENIFFAYSDAIVLQNVSMEFHKGELIGILGANGSGKSTLAKVIAGLYSPNSGTMLINGLSLYEYFEDDIKQKIHITFQDYSIFSLSIAENILMHAVNNERDENLVIETLKTVGLYNKISTLKHGIYTYLTNEMEEGVSFSGGEFQRISIARMLASESSIIILDEAFSEIDSLTKKTILEYISNSKREKIFIMITHQPSDLENADRIFYITEGVVAEYN